MLGYPGEDWRRVGNPVATLRVGEISSVLVDAETPLVKLRITW
jgi:hypothetical protein